MLPGGRSIGVEGDGTATAGSFAMPEIHESWAHPLAEWIDDFRSERESWRGKANREQGRTRRRAVITMVYNEAVFLPIWLRYYSRFFAPEDIYVLDNETDDGSTDIGGLVTERVERGRVDHRWMKETIERKQHLLFEQGYEIVLVTDVDELVVPDPSLGDLGDYMDTMIEDYVSCLGYEVVHFPNREPPLDPKRPIGAQRSFWTENAFYNKSALATTPSTWEPGFHRREDGHFRFDPDLYMVHLHRADYEVCLARHQLRSRRPWGAEDDKADMAAHNRITEKGRFDRWFFTEPGMEGFTLRIERIPEHMRGAF